MCHSWCEHWKRRGGRKRPRCRCYREHGEGLSEERSDNPMWRAEGQRRGEQPGQKVVPGGRRWRSWRWKRGNTGAEEGTVVREEQEFMTRKVRQVNTLKWPGCVFCFKLAVICIFLAQSVVYLFLAKSSNHATISCCSLQPFLGATVGSNVADSQVYQVFSNCCRR